MTTAAEAGQVDSGNILAFSFGDNNTTLSTQFLAYSSIRYIYGFERFKGTTIPAFFLRNTYNFNQELIVPDSITSIDSGFLLGSNIRDAHVLLPSSITSVGATFMSQCYNYTGPLTVNTEAHPIDNATLAANVPNPRLFNPGVTINGTGAVIWKEALPDSTTSFKRKLILAE